MAIVLVVAVPVALSGWVALGQVWRPSGDWAVLALRVSDVGSATPLVGPYSRYGWNHPGPLLYWVLAAPYHLLGGRPVDLLFGTALLNAAALAGTAALAWRRGRLPLLLLTAAALSLLVRGLGPEILRNPWNPYITLAPMALFAFLAWSVAEGERWPIPVAVVVGSFLVQSHIGYVVVVGAFSVAATAYAVAPAWRRRRNGDTHSDTHPDLADDATDAEPASTSTTPRHAALLIAATVLAALVCWAPVALDQFDGSGNVSQIVTSFTAGEETPQGLGAALGFAARHLSLPEAPWLGAVEPTNPVGGGQVPASAVGLVLPALAYVLALLAARRVGARSAVRFQVLVGVGVLAGLAATARITGDPYAYLLRWWWVLAMLFWLGVTWSAGNALWRWAAIPRAARRVATVGAVPVALVVLVGLGAGTATAGSRAEVPDGSLTAILGEVVDPTVAALRDSGPVMVRATGSVWGTAADGVRFELERHGIEVVADPGDAFRLGPQRSATTRRPVATVWVVSADAATDWMRRSDLELVAHWDPLDPLARAGYLALAAEVQAQLVAAGRPDLARNLATGGDTTGADLVPGVDLEALRDVEQIRRRGDPIAVFVGPPV